MSYSDEEYLAMEAERNAARARVAYLEEAVRARDRFIDNAPLEGLALLRDSGAWRTWRERWEVVRSAHPVEGRP